MQLQSFVRAFVTVLILSTAALADNGGNGSGGGNGLQGKAFESYIVDVTKLPEYKNVLKPIGVYLKQLRPNSSEDSQVIDCSDQTLIDVVARSKTWYVAPVHLPTIAKAKLGVDFLMDPVQQLAIQTGNEIWVNDQVWKKMSGPARAHLLMHEIVEALYLVRFMPMGDLEKIIFKSCRVSPSAAQQALAYSDQDPESAADEAKRPLAATDYAMIRSATDELLNNYKHIKSDIDLDDFFMKFNFSKKLMTTQASDQEKLQSYTFDTKQFFSNGSANGYCGKNSMDAGRVACTTVVGSDGTFTIASDDDGSVLKTFKVSPFYLNMKTPGSSLSTCPAGTGFCFWANFESSDSDLKIDQLKVGDELETVWLWIQEQQATNVSTDANGKRVESQQMFQSISDMYFFKRRVISINVQDELDSNGNKTGRILKQINFISLKSKPVFIFSVAPVSGPTFHKNVDEISSTYSTYSYNYSSLK